MARKQSIEELEAAAKAAEARAKELRKKAAALTAKQEAEAAAKLLAAVRKYGESKFGRTVSDAELTSMFEQWTARNIERQHGNAQ